MKVPTLLATLRDRDIQVWADGDSLRCSAPAGTLTPELCDQLREGKSEILSFLQSAGSLARQPRSIVPLESHGTRPPVFAFGGHNGDVFCFRALARHLGGDQPFFGLQPPGLDGQEEPLARVEHLAAYFATAIRASQPNGPYVIAGFCAGGAIAFELARQLDPEGKDLCVLALFGAAYPTAYRRLRQLRNRGAEFWQRFVKHARTLATSSFEARRLYIAQKLCARPTVSAIERPAAPAAVLAQRARVARATFAALRCYQPGHFSGRLGLFLPSRGWVHSSENPLRWRAKVRHVQEYFGPDDCSTDKMLQDPYAPLFADLFKQWRDSVFQMENLDEANCPGPQPSPCRCSGRRAVQSDTL
jgi:thioesterase domain-containing protein